MRILVVDDDESIAGFVKTALTEQRYTVDIATDGQAGWQLAEDLAYDLIVLDVMLPKLDGISFCKRLRSQGSQIPILLLTAKDASSDKVAGLDAGADDYLVKPLDLQELSARIRALLRRGHGNASPLLEYGELRLNPQNCEVVYGSHPLHLTPKEYALLELFLRNNQRVFSRSTILDQLWAFDDEPPGEDTVKTHIKGLRQKLKAVGAADLVETVYGLGYRLNHAYLKPRTATSTTLEKQANQTRAVVAKIWERAKGKILQRIQLLEQVSEALSMGFLSPEKQEEAQQEAHKLAGALGTFGIHRGTEIARQIEGLLEQSLPLNAQELHRLQSLVTALKQTVESADHLTSETSASSEVNVKLKEEPILYQSKLLAIGNDSKFLELLITEGSDWELQVAIATDLDTAKQQFEQIKPNIVLLDLPLTELEGESLTFLTNLENQKSPLPVIALTEFNQLSDRLTVSRLKGWSLLQKPLELSQVFTVVTQILRRTQTTTVNLLVVDDDPLILKILKAVLEPWGMNVFTLRQPDQFWTRLPEVAPDLVILDVQMSDVGGIDLCQTLRNDTRWRWLPVLFLTGETEADKIAQLYEAGADDYISKPIRAPELVARILNRLERQRSLRSHFEVNHGSNISDRRQFIQEANRYLKLAKRFQQPFCLAVLEMIPQSQSNPSSESNLQDLSPKIEPLIRQELSEEDLLTQWSNNRWVVGFYGMTRRESVERLATILEGLREKQLNAANGEPLKIRFNAGVAQYLNDGGTLQSLYHAAETLLAYGLPEIGRVLPVGWQPPSQNSLQTDVLLVHPASTFATSVINALKTRGYHYRWLEDEETALNLLEGATPKLWPTTVIWSGELPDMEILPFLKRWKKNKLVRDIRLILLLPTSTGEIGNLLELVTFDYVMTPCHPNVLMQCLYRSLEFSLTKTIPPPPLT